MGFVGWERTLWIGGWLGRLGDLLIRAMFTKAPSPLSLLATCSITIKTTGKTGRPQNISSIRRNQLVPVQPPFLNFFWHLCSPTCTYFTLHIQPVGKVSTFCETFWFSREKLCSWFSPRQSHYHCLFTCLSSGPKVDVYWFYNMGNSERWTIFNINFICLGVCSKVIISWLGVMLWVRCSRKDQICS